MTNDMNLDLIERHLLFDNPNEWTIASGLGRDWPDGRALYANVTNVQSQTPDFMIWVNEEDHLRIMCLRSGGDIQGVFTTLWNGLHELERELSIRGWHFCYDARYGYLTSCPTNAGTAMRASVHVRLVNLGRLPGFFELVERLKLEVRGMYGETDRHYTGIFDISNAERLGKSEVHLINVMVDGVAKLIELERKLEAGEQVDICEIARS
jgi:protein-arginine kinase